MLQSPTLHKTNVSFKSVEFQFIAVHEDDLKTLWQCYECGRNFIYLSDVEDHKRTFNHSKMISRDLDKKTMAEFIRDQVAFNFKVSGKPAMAIIEYKYYPSTDAITYVDVKYTDSSLQSWIEGDPKMMRNVDNLLRKHVRSLASGKGGPQKI